MYFAKFSAALRCKFYAAEMTGSFIAVRGQSMVYLKNQTDASRQKPGGICHVIDSSAAPPRR